MKKLTAVLAAGLLTLALAVPGVAQAAITASIVGANIDPAGTQVSVSNMNLTFDDCGGSDPMLGFVFGGCGGVAGVVPASQTCPSGGAGLQASLWDTGDGYFASAGTKTFNSGALSAAVSSPVAYRVCLYAFFSNSNSGRGNLGLRADALTPAPTPASTSTGPTGHRAAATKKCKKFPKGPKRQKCIKKAKKLPV